MDILRAVYLLYRSATADKKNIMYMWVHSRLKIR